MTVKINASILGIKKPIEVKESNKNMRATLKLQLDMSKTRSFDDDLTVDEFIQNQLKLMDLEQDFVTKMLRLDEKSAKKIDDIMPKELDDLTSDIIMKIQHIDPEISAETEEDKNEDPKEKKPE